MASKFVKSEYYGGDSVGSSTDKLSSNSQLDHSRNSFFLSSLGLSHSNGEEHKKREEIHDPDFYEKLRVKRIKSQTKRYSPSIAPIRLKRKTSAPNSSANRPPVVKKETNATYSRMARKIAFKEQSDTILKQIKNSLECEKPQLSYSVKKSKQNSSVPMCISDILVNLAEDADPSLFDEKSFSTSTDFWNAVLRHAQQRYLQYIETSRIVFYENDNAVKHEPASPASSISNPDYLDQFVSYTDN